jgi:iron complex outermembrane receptor protein
MNPSLHARRPPARDHSCKNWKLISGPEKLLRHLAENSRDIRQECAAMKKSACAGLCLPILASVFCPTLVALAQDVVSTPQAANQPVTTTVQVIVTGSNIPTAEEVGPNPVFILNRDLINKSGQATTAEQLLKIQPVMNAGSIPVSNNATGLGGPAGTASVSLRGFDPGATLVLIDGRRVTPFPGNANSGAGFIDLLTLPITAVQSIEILKDGASTTYGADAVAGVINLKFYKDYRGAQLTLYYGDTLDKDAGLYSGDILFGTGDDKVSVVGDIFFYHHNSMFNRDRGNSLKPPFVSSNTSPWNLQVSTAVALGAGAVFGTAGVPGQIPVGAGTRIFTTPPTGTNGLASVSHYIFNTDLIRGEDGLLPGFNFDLFAGSFPEQERWGGYAAFNDKICDDQLQLYGDFYYTDVKSRDELAPNATGNFETIGFFTIFVPPHAPIAAGAEPPGTPTAAQVSAPAGAFNPFNPFGQFISGQSSARIADFGNRISLNENEAWLSTIGVKGDKLFDGSWGYDAGFRYSQILSIGQARDVNGPRFERILNANDSIFNPASSDYIGQTIPYNPFNDFKVPIKGNLPLINFATLHAHNLFTSKFATFDVNIYTTDLFDLPGGPVGLAVGGSFSRQTYDINPDDQNSFVHPQELGTGGTQPVKAGRKEVAFYGELRIPIFSPEMGVPGLHSLEFDAGARFEDWRNNDTNALVPKVALRWQPFDEQLTVRSTWGEGFLEPSMTELYGPTIFSVGPAHFHGFAPAALFGPPNSATNPLQDVVNPETTIEEPPNRHLAPEHDRTWTGGIVYTPKWVPPQWGSFTFTVDLWDVERTGVLMTVAPQVIINEYEAEAVPGVGPIPTITTPARPKSGQTAVLFDPTGGFVGVASPPLSGGRQDARGVDLELQYQIQTPIGTFSSLTRTTYLEDFVFAFPGGKQAFHVAGRANNDFIEGSFFGSVTGGDGLMRWRGTEVLDWTWKNWDLNWTVHYLGGFREEIFNKKIDGFEKLHFVNATWFTDASFSYSFIFTPLVESQPVAGYSKGGKEVMTNKQGKAIESTAAYSMPCWKTVLNNTTLTVGVNNIFGQDPPTEFGFEFGDANEYPGFLYDNLGRFVYARLIKRF